MRTMLYRPGAMEVFDGVACDYTIVSDENVKSMTTKKGGWFLTVGECKPKAVKDDDED